MELEQNYCPGCGRHCSAQAARCPYGREYFAKQMQSHGEKQHKWERDVQPGGLMWKFLGTGHRVKKTLHKGYATEAQLIAMLSEEEKSAFTALLNKIDPGHSGI